MPLIVWGGKRFKDLVEKRSIDKYVAMLHLYLLGLYVDIDTHALIASFLVEIYFRDGDFSYLDTYRLMPLYSLLAYLHLVSVELDYNVAGAKEYIGVRFDGYILDLLDIRSFIITMSMRFDVFITKYLNIASNAPSLGRRTFLKLLPTLLL